LLGSSTTNKTVVVRDVVYGKRVNNSCNFTILKNDIFFTDKSSSLKDVVL